MVLFVVVLLNYVFYKCNLIYVWCFFFLSVIYNLDGDVKEIFDLCFLKRIRVIIRVVWCRNIYVFFVIMIDVKYIYLMV